MSLQPFNPAYNPLLLDNAAAVTSTLACQVQPQATTTTTEAAAVAAAATEDAVIAPESISPSTAELEFIRRQQPEWAAGLFCTCSS